MTDLRPSASASEVWTSLKRLTQARISVGRSGDALPTSAVLAFETAQALARDAVHLPLDLQPLVAGLASLGFSTVQVQSSAADRETYLRRPDAGRRLSQAGVEALEKLPSMLPGYLCIVIGDGLSAAAVANHAVGLVAALHQAGVSMAAPVFLATQARVALGDEIGERMRAEAVLVLLGERPGLSTPDSLGAYLTWGPRVGRTDAERNCVSNIHANGLTYGVAAHKLATLLRQARRLGLTGVQLHDEAEPHDPELPVSSAR